MMREFVLTLTFNLDRKTSTAAFSWVSGSSTAPAVAGLSPGKYRPANSRTHEIGDKMQPENVSSACLSAPGFLSGGIFELNSGRSHSFRSLVTWAASVRERRISISV